MPLGSIDGTRFLQEASPVFIANHKGPDFIRSYPSTPVNCDDRRASLLRGALEEEGENSRCNLIAVCLQCEMPGIE